MCASLPQNPSRHRVEAASGAARSTWRRSVIATGPPLTAGASRSQWCGIQNTSDFQVKADWIDSYADSVRAVPWYSVLGNHEYGYNVQAQIDLSSIYPTWVMPARYYTKRVALSSSQHLSMIFLDSSPCVSEYRSSSPARWDPCGVRATPFGCPCVCR